VCFVHHDPKQTEESSRVELKQTQSAPEAPHQ
jgi:hypothetical protein